MLGPVRKWTKLQYLVMESAEDEMVHSKYEEYLPHRLLVTIRLVGK